MVTERLPTSTLGWSQPPVVPPTIAAFQCSQTTFVQGADLLVSPAGCASQLPAGQRPTYESTGEHLRGADEALWERVRAEVSAVHGAALEAAGVAEKKWLTAARDRCAADKIAHLSRAALQSRDILFSVLPIL